MPLHFNNAAVPRRRRQWDSFPKSSLQAQAQGHKKGLPVEAVDDFQFVVIPGIQTYGMTGNLGVEGETRSQGDGLSMESPQGGAGTVVRSHLLVDVACQTQGKALGQVL